MTARNNNAIRTISEKVTSIEGRVNVTEGSIRSIEDKLVELEEMFDEKVKANKNSIEELLNTVNGIIVESSKRISNNNKASMARFESDTLKKVSAIIQDHKCNCK